MSPALWPKCTKVADPRLDVSRRACVPSPRRLNRLLIGHENVLARLRHAPLGGAVVIFFVALVGSGAAGLPPRAAAPPASATVAPIDLGVPMEVAIDVNGVEEPTTVALRRGGVTHEVTAFIRRVSVPPA